MYVFIFDVPFPGPQLAKPPGWESQPEMSHWWDELCSRYPGFWHYLGFFHVRPLGFVWCPKLQFLPSSRADSGWQLFPVAVVRLVVTAIPGTSWKTPSAATHFPKQSQLSAFLSDEVQEESGGTGIQWESWLGKGPSADAEQSSAEPRGGARNLLCAARGHERGVQQLFITEKLQTGKKIPVSFFPDGDIPVCPVSPTPPLSTSNGAKEDAGNEPRQRLPGGSQPPHCRACDHWALHRSPNLPCPTPPSRLEQIWKPKNPSCCHGNAARCTTSLSARGTANPVQKPDLPILYLMEEVPQQVSETPEEDYFGMTARSIWGWEL